MRSHAPLSGALSGAMTATPAGMKSGQSWRNMLMINSACHVWSPLGWGCICCQQGMGQLQRLACLCTVPRLGRCVCPSCVQRRSRRHVNRARQVGHAVICLIQVTPFQISTAACCVMCLYDDSSHSWQMLQWTTGPAVLCTVLQPGPDRSAVPRVAPEGQPQQCACARLQNRRGGTSVLLPVV